MPKASSIHGRTLVVNVNTTDKVIVLFVVHHSKQDH